MSVVNHVSKFQAAVRKNGLLSLFPLYTLQLLEFARPQFEKMACYPCFPDTPSSYLSLSDHKSTATLDGNNLEYKKYTQRLDRPPPTYPPGINVIRFVYLMLCEILPILPSLNEKTVWSVFLCPSNNLTYTWKKAKMSKNSRIIFFKAVQDRID